MLSASQCFSLHSHGKRELRKQKGVSEVKEKCVNGRLISLCRPVIFPCHVKHDMKHTEPVQEKGLRNKGRDGPVSRKKKTGGRV